LDPIVGDGGCSFHRNGGQNVDTSFVNFSAGTTFGQVFENSSEISFSLKSAYSLAERQALAAPNMRSAFEVYDDVGPMFNFSTFTLSNGALQFGFGARGSGAVYTVAAGQEDALYGKGVVLKICVKWTPTAFSLYLNNVLAQTNSLSSRSTNWSSQSAFTIGSRSIRNAGGGYDASDDTVAEFVVR
jgi:hypothetical protein